MLRPAEYHPWYRLRDPTRPQCSPKPFDKPLYGGKLLVRAISLSPDLLIAGLTELICLRNPRVTTPWTPMQ